MNLNIKSFGTLIEKKVYENWNSTFLINFDQAVRITESFFPSPSFTQLLSEFGGAFGLWLGLGLLQLCFYFLNLTHLVSFQKLLKWIINQMKLIKSIYLNICAICQSVWEICLSTLAWYLEGLRNCAVVHVTEGLTD